MLIDISSDGHIHTTYCHHATGSMEDYVQSAIEKGLREIFFLEHMEEGIQSQRVTWLTDKDFDDYFAEGQRLKEKYCNRITIGLGVEVGYNPDQSKKLLERLSYRKWDRIGVSVHFLLSDDTGTHINLVSKRDPQLLRLKRDEARRIESQYYIALAEAVELLPGSVVCHIDGVLRYHPERNSIEPPWDLIDTLLYKIQQNGMAVEVNTSGIAIRGEVFPCNKILGKVLKRKIPLVAGSDSHKPEDVGFHFEQLETIINAAWNFPD